jgi:hypothetical protein
LWLVLAKCPGLFRRDERSGEGHVSSVATNGSSRSAIAAASPVGPIKAND